MKYGDYSTGFLLPEAEITDTGEETWEAIKVLIHFLLGSHLHITMRM
jgi:hypothetical protein